MADIIGQSVGRYHIIEKLGEGGMAIVYKAYDTHLECEVALKIIRTDQLAPSLLERALKRFEREAKAVARLSHPNIVKVTDYGEFEGQPYLVMPYLRGGTLKSLLAEREKIPWQEAAQILLPIANALSYAHECGVIHRDIKPSNILLTEKGEPMLTDFGVAKIVGDEVTQDLTGTSATVGTPEYMAPEQVTSKLVDHRADIYGLGVVFYEMVTGRRPFEADTPLAVLFKHASDPLPRPSSYTKDLPAAVENVLIKALMKKPEDRYQAMGEMIKGLIDLLATQSKFHPEMAKFENFVSKQGISSVDKSDSNSKNTLNLDPHKEYQEIPPGETENKGLPVDDSFYPDGSSKPIRSKKRKIDFIYLFLGLLIIVFASFVLKEKSELNKQYSLQTAIIQLTKDEGNYIRQVTQTAQSQQTVQSQQTATSIYQMSNNAIENQSTLTPTPGGCLIDDEDIISAGSQTIEGSTYSVTFVNEQSWPQDDYELYFRNNDGGWCDCTSSYGCEISEKNPTRLNCQGNLYCGGAAFPLTCHYGFGLASENCGSIFYNYFVQTFYGD